MSQRMRWAGLLLASFLLCGCDETNPFDKKYIPPQMKPPTRVALRVTSRSLTFVYVPVNKRDPFRPAHLTQAATQTVQPKQPTDPLVERRPEPQTELEKFELDQLRVVATITGVANPVAMVEDPQGMGHVVRRGTPMGRNGGRVRRIHNDGIILETETRDKTGRRFFNFVKLAIKSKSLKKTQGQILIGGRQLRFN